MAVRADDVDLLRDRALVERFQSGYVDGFEDLYRRYFARLHRFCMKRLDGDAHEAEEVAQEAFARAFRAMPDLDGERRFYPWLTVIAARLCVDAHRRRGRSVPAPDIDLGVIEGGQEAVVEAVDHELLTQAMARLSERHREVLQLREHQGWSYHRIAEHLGVTQGTIEALLFRARRALRREFLSLDESNGRLAALPVIGWLLRRAHSTQARMSTWVAQGAGQVAAAAVPLAIVASSVAVAAVGDAAPQPVEPRTQLAAAVSPGGEFGALPAAGASTATATAPGASLAPPSAGVAPPRGGGEGGGFVGESQTDYGTGRTRAADDPVAADTPVGFVAADPDEVVADTSRFLTAATGSVVDGSTR